MGDDRTRCSTTASTCSTASTRSGIGVRSRSRCVPSFASGSPSTSPPRIKSGTSGDLPQLRGGRAMHDPVTLTAKREKFKAPKGTGTIALTSYKQTASKPRTTQSRPRPAQPRRRFVPVHGAKLSDGGLLHGRRVERRHVFRRRLRRPPSRRPDKQSVRPAHPCANPKTGRIVGYPNAVMTTSGRTRRALADSSRRGRQPQPAKREKATRTSSRTTVRSSRTSKPRSPWTRLQDAGKAPPEPLLVRPHAGGFVHVRPRPRVRPRRRPVLPPSNAQGVVGELVLLPSANLTLKYTGRPSHPPGTKIMIRPVSDARVSRSSATIATGVDLRSVTGSSSTRVVSRTFQAANVVHSARARGGPLHFPHGAVAGPGHALRCDTRAPHPPFRPSNRPICRRRASSLPTGQAPRELVPPVHNAGTNFATVATLGSPAQTGTFPSVEASQISRGLTLAEMTIVDNQTGSQDGLSSTQPQCMCLLGRSDLAFINTGYQTTTLQKTTPDPTTLPNPNAITAAQIAVANAQAALTAAQHSLSLDQQFGFPLMSSRSLSSRYHSSNQSEQRDVHAELPSAGIGHAAPAGAGEYVQPPVDQVTTIINNYLFGLYQTLDGPHQTYEQQLRGGIYQAPQPGANGVISVGPTSALGDLAPPFNPASQGVTGNPAAAASSRQVIGEPTSPRRGTASRRTFGPTPRSRRFKRSSRPTRAALEPSATTCQAPSPGFFWGGVRGHAAPRPADRYAPSADQHAPTEDRGRGDAARPASPAGAHSPVATPQTIPATNPISQTAFGGAG